MKIENENKLLYNNTDQNKVLTKKNLVFSLIDMQEPG